MLWGRQSTGEKFWRPATGLLEKYSLEEEEEEEEEEFITSGNGRGRHNSLSRCKRSRAKKAPRLFRVRLFNHTWQNDFYHVDTSSHAQQVCYDRPCK